MKLKAFELHIGSIVEYKGNIVILTAEDFKQLEDDIELGIIKPVKLTDEFFLVNGFKKVEGDFIFDGYKYVINGELMFTPDSYNYKAICETEFIHQLQTGHIMVMHQEFPFKKHKEGGVVMGPEKEKENESKK